MEDIWLLNSCPETIRGTEVEELFTRSELAKMTVAQRIKYEESAMTQNDILNSVAEQLEEAREIAIAEGRAEGHAEGHAEGVMEERRNNVRKMHAAFSVTFQAR